MTKIVFLDTETTGLDPSRHELLEVAMISRDLLNPDKTVHFSLGIDPDKADATALKVNRWHERQEELQKILVPDTTAGHWLVETLKGAIVVGNNPQFDLRFIEFFLQHNTMEYETTPWNYHPVDLKALVAGAYRMGPPPWSTGKIAEAVKVPIPDNYHSALVDAQWNRDVFDAVMAYEPLRLPNGAVNPRPIEID